MKTLLSMSLGALAAALLATTALAADLRILTAVTGGKDAAEQALFVKELEQHLGLSIEMVKPESDYDNVLFTALAGGEDFDLVYGDSSMLPKFLGQGAVMDVTDLVAKSTVLSNEAEIPAGEWKLFDVGGKKYGVPNKFEGGTMPVVREDWVKEFGLKDPVTLDDWMAFFKKAKEVKGAYGLSMAGLYDIQGFMSAKGLKAGYVTVDGKRTIPYATDAAAAMYDWFADLYKQGLLDPAFATNGSAEFRKLFMSDRVAAVTYWDAWVGLFNNIVHTDKPNSPFEAKGIAGVPGSDGRVILRRGESSLWFIPTNAKHVANAIKFLEFWHSKPGYVMGTLGIKDVDYTVRADGTYELTEQGKKHSLDHGSPRVSSTTWTNPFGMLPGVLDAQTIILKSGATIEDKPAAWADAGPIVEKYAFSAMTGEITGAEAVARMQAELKSAKLID